MSNILYIAHRVNTVQELLAIDEQYGVEVDLRDHGDKIVLVHDPFIIDNSHTEFEEYLRHFRHAFIILNIKSERIEERVQALLQKYDITQYFFLDSSFPMIVKLTAAGESKIAVRYSEYEPLEAVLAMQGKVEWVWVDCFTRYPLTPETSRILRAAGFKICMVSPELQKHDMSMLETGTCDSANRIYDAICCKSYNIDKVRHL